MTDQTGAVVPSAKVVAANVDTGVAQTTITDERGGFLFNNLQVGTYKLIVTMPSFKTQVQENIKVDANTVYRFDMQLQVGDVSATVEVSETSVPLQTERADINVVQTARQVNDLPLAGSVGRNYL